METGVLARLVETGNGVMRPLPTFVLVLAVVVGAATIGVLCMGEEAKKGTLEPLTPSNSEPVTIIIPRQQPKKLPSRNVIANTMRPVKLMLQADPAKNVVQPGSVNRCLVYTRFQDVENGKVRHQVVLRCGE